MRQRRRLLWIVFAVLLALQLAPWLIGWLS